MQEENSWGEYRRLVLKELQELHEELKRQGHRISAIEKFYFKLKTYVAIAASVISLFISAIPALIEKWLRH